MNAEQLYEKLLAKLRELKQASSFELVGLAMGGAWIAERLAKDLGLPHYGVINVAFHRDDYAEKGMTALRTASTMTTHLPFDVNGATVILIDDVLFTGRSIRSALTAIQSFGRPSEIELLVLIDRRFSRNLPIQPDYRGRQVDAINNEKVKVCWKENDGEDGVYLITN